MCGLIALVVVGGAAAWTVVKAFPHLFVVVVAVYLFVVVVAYLFWLGPARLGRGEAYPEENKVWERRFDYNTQLFYDAWVGNKSGGGYKPARPVVAFGRIWYPPEEGGGNETIRQAERRSERSSRELPR